ncbi:MAG: prepilin-type N-terminal cleavage/methylation domain-containing protein [Syntrophomonas sp.]
MKQKKAFTLIELLVVIAIIALLLAIIVPSLRLAKKKASSIVCMMNTKHLGLGWVMYQQNNDGRIMSATEEATESDGTRVGWIGKPYAVTLGDRAPASGPAVTDEDEIRGIMRGRLYEYIDDPKTYHCPGDHRKSLYDGTNLLNSYTVALCLYGSPSPAFGFWSPYIERTQITKYSQITLPSMRYVFVESANEKNYNSQGHFYLGTSEYTKESRPRWICPVAINHGDSSVLGFADGSSQTHRWVDPYTKEWVYKLSKNGGSYSESGTGYPPPGQTADIDYMVKGWARRPRTSDYQ